MSDDALIQETPVHRRDDAPSKLYGFTWGEMGAMAGSFLASQILFGNTKLSLGVTFLVFGYIKKVKASLPDNYLSNAIKFYLRSHFIYRATARDAEWRPPILPPAR